MAIDFQQVRQQIIALGEAAPVRQERLQNLREHAWHLLEQYAEEFDFLHNKVESITRNYEKNLRCALTCDPHMRLPEALTFRRMAPELPPFVTLLAADGSQIAPDRHAAIDYCLINVGAIEMRHGTPDAPTTNVTSDLLYDEELYTATGQITDARLALMRDMLERSILAVLAEQARAPVISFTDGPMELWGGGSSGDETYFQQTMESYQNVLRQLCDLKVATAGYIDKPAANLVVRLLEVAITPEEHLKEIKKYFPLRGVTDLYLFRRLLRPGERSAVFSLQSFSAAQYHDELSLHFFYLNVGKPGHPWISRVEIPGWVARNDEMLDNLQAALVSQCGILGSRPYPYLLHRAHEAALVTRQEKEQVTQMIALELRRRGVEIGEQSNKQAAKDLPGRTSILRGGRG